MNGERCGTDRGTRRPECCPLCDSHLVEPVYWAHRGSGRWVLDLRCPECEAEYAVTLDEEAVHAYNVLLFDAADDLATGVRRLEEEWSADVEDEDRRFVEALRADRVLPADF